VTTTERRGRTRAEQTGTFTGLRRAAGASRSGDEHVGVKPASEQRFAGAFENRQRGEHGAGDEERVEPENSAGEEERAGDAGVGKLAQVMPSMLSVTRFTAGRHTAIRAVSRGRTGESAVESVGQPCGVGRVTSRGERPAPHRVMRPTTSAQRFQRRPTGDLTFSGCRLKMVSSRDGYWWFATIMDEFNGCEV
jgi:hypothetical protein